MGADHVKHVSDDPLDCRRCNLRVVVPAAPPPRPQQSDLSRVSRYTKKSGKSYWRSSWRAAPAAPPSQECFAVGKYGEEGAKERATIHQLLLRDAFPQRQRYKEEDEAATAARRAKAMEIARACESKREHRLVDRHLGPAGASDDDVPRDSDNDE